MGEVGGRDDMGEVEKNFSVWVVGVAIGDELADMVMPKLPVTSVPSKMLLEIETF